MLWCLGFIYIYYLKVGLTLYAGVKLKDHEAEGATWEGYEADSQDQEEGW